MAQATRGNQANVAYAIENSVLCSAQQPGSAVNSIVDQGEFEVANMLSGCRALCCDKHQFCAKMTVSTLKLFK